MRHGKARIKYPFATVMPYGPDDRTVTKLAVTIMFSKQEHQGGPMQRWVGTGLESDEAAAREIRSCGTMASRRS